MSARPLEQACKTLLNCVLLLAAYTAIKNLFQTNSARVSSRRMLCRVPFPFVYSRASDTKCALCFLVAQCSQLRSMLIRSHAYTLARIHSHSISLCVHCFCVLLLLLLLLLFSIHCILRSFDETMCAHK